MPPSGPYWPLRATNSVRSPRVSGSRGEPMPSRTAAATIRTVSVMLMPKSEMAVNAFLRLSTLRASLICVFMSGHLTTVEQADNAIGPVREAIVVRDHDHGGAVIAVETFENS